MSSSSVLGFLCIAGFSYCAYLVIFGRRPKQPRNELIANRPVLHLRPSNVTTDTCGMHYESDPNTE